MLFRQFAILAVAAASCSAFMSQSPRVIPSNTKLFSSLLTKDDASYEASLAADIEREVRLDPCFSIWNVLVGLLERVVQKMLLWDRQNGVYSVFESEARHHLTLFQYTCDSRNLPFPSHSTFTA